MKTNFGKLITLLCLALLLGACDALPWAAETQTPTSVPVVNAQGIVSAEGRLAPLRYSALGFIGAGMLDEVAVSEGDAVAAGAVLARLGQREPLLAALSQAKAEQLAAQQALDELNTTAALAREQHHQALVEAKAALTRAQTALNDLDTDDFQQELDDLNIAVDDAQDALDDAKETLAKRLDLDADNAIRKNAQTAYDDAVRSYNGAVYERDDKQNQLDLAKAALDLAAARVENAQRLYDNRIKGVDGDSLALAEARLSLASDQVAAAQRALENADLTAPYAGTVMALFDLEPGELVNAGQPVVTLADLTAWVVETRDFSELDVVNVAVGDAVTVIPDALPELKLSGTVEAIDRVYTERSGDILFTARIRLDEGDERLRWGMTVNVVFGD